MKFIKKLKDAITGGSVDVEITFDKEQAVLGQEIEFEVSALVGSDPVNMKGAYLQVEGTEVIEIPWSEIDVNYEKKPARFSKYFESKEATFSEKIRLHGPEALQALTEYNWTGTIALPEDGFPTMQCRKMKHVWFVKSFIKVSTRNPSSGWIELEVKA